MISIFLKKYKQFNWNVGKWKKRKRRFKWKMAYNWNNLLILNWILGRLNKEGHKTWSFFILTNILLLLKKKNKRKPKKTLSTGLRRLKQNVLLFNKRRGSLIFELPRFLSIEQSIKKIIEWWIKSARKNKKNIIPSLMKEWENILYRKGDCDVLKKKKHIKDTIRKNRPFFYILKKKKKRKSKIK